MLGAIGGLTGLLGLGASLISGGAAIYGGITQAKQAKKQAKLIKEQSAFEAAKSRRDTRRLMGQQRANYAAAGIQIEGTPALLIEETENLGEQEAQNILKYGDASAKAYKSQGKNALIGGLLGGGAGLLGGYAENRMYVNRYPELRVN